MSDEHFVSILLLISGSRRPLYGDGALEDAQPGHLPRAGPAQQPAGAAEMEPVTQAQRPRAGTAAPLFPV